MRVSLTLKVKKQLNSSMENIKLRRVVEGDVDVLQQISEQTFVETFADVNTEEDMRKFLAEAYNLDKLRGELSNAFTEFYFAEINNRVIGYLKINTSSAQTEQQGDEALEIERIYVVKEFLGQKIGQLLFDKAIDRAKGKDKSFVWLGVWEENKRALRFYEKNGFIAFDKHIFQLGADEQIDIMMKKMLK